MKSFIERAEPELSSLTPKEANRSVDRGSQNIAQLLKASFNLFSDVHHSFDGRKPLPWKGLVAFAAHLHFERGTQMHNVLSIVRNIIVTTTRHGELTSFVGSPWMRFWNSTGIP